MTDQELLTHLERIAREGLARPLTGDYVTKYILKYKTDACAMFYAPVTAQIAAALAVSTSSLRKHLARLVREGKVMREPVKPHRGIPTRWWPVGLAERLVGEAAA